MADVKISDLPAAASLGAADILPAVEGGATKKATTAQVVAGGGGALASRQVISGAGLTGGGDLSADRTLAVAANADGSIVVNADDIQVGVLASDAQHGNRGGGAIHAAATGSVAGFMPAADKAKLDALGVFGSEAYQASNEGAALATTSPSQQTSLSWTTPALLGGTYRIGWYTQVGAINDTGGGYAWSSLYLDGAAVQNSYEDTGQFHATSAYFSQFTGFKDVALAAGTHTLIMYLASTAGANVYHLNRRFYIYRINP